MDETGRDLLTTAGTLAALAGLILAGPEGQRPAVRMVRVVCAGCWGGQHRACEAPCDCTHRLVGQLVRAAGERA